MGEYGSFIIKHCFSFSYAIRPRLFWADVGI